MIECKSALKGKPRVSCLSVHSPDTLKEAPVPIISTKRCNSTCMYNGEITSRMLCAGYTEGKVDACQVGCMFCNATSTRCCERVTLAAVIFCFKQYCRDGCRGCQCASVCLYLSRGTVGVLWSARMKACGGWWASWAGAQAALNPIILVFTPKSLNSWAGSTTLSRQTDFRHRSDQSHEVYFPFF